MEPVFFASRSAADAYTCARRWYKFRNVVITKVGTTSYPRGKGVPHEISKALDAYLRELAKVGAVTRRCPPNCVGFGPAGKPDDDEFCEESHREYSHVLLLSSGNSAAIEFEVEERTAEWVGQCKAAGRVPSPAPYNAQGLPVILVGKGASEEKGAPANRRSRRSPRKPRMRS